MSISAMPRRAQYDEAYSAGAIAANLIVSGDRTAITIAAGITAVPYGVTAEAFAAGETKNVQTEGWAVVLAGAAGMTAGSWVMPEAGGTGCGVDATAASGANCTVIGRCELAAASGKLGLVKLGFFEKQFA